MNMTLKMRTTSFMKKKMKTTSDMEVSSSLAGIAEKSRKMLEFGISLRRKFENANLLAEDFPLFPCLQILGKL